MMSCWLRLFIGKLESGLQDVGVMDARRSEQIVNLEHNVAWNDVRSRK